MRQYTLAALLICGFLGFATAAQAQEGVRGYPFNLEPQSPAAQAQEGVRVRPVDFYISGFGGYSFPFKTDMEFLGVTSRNETLDTSPSVGGKFGMWFTAPRKRLGIDIGVEFDVTNFSPNWPGNLDLNATYFGVHVLARLPMEVTQDLPNGRWFPYIGVGGGAQHLTAEVPGFTFVKGSHTAPAFQGLWGAKMFITKHIALFGEGKYTHASHAIEVGVEPFMLPPLDLTVHALHGVGGLSVHF